MTRTQALTLVVLTVVVACVLCMALGYARIYTSSLKLPAPTEARAPTATPKPRATKEPLIVPVGQLSGLERYPTDRDVFVQKKDGTTDPRPNDLEELCKDWLFYRQKILEYTASGKTEKAEKARAAFQDVNAWLGEYDDSDVAAMFSILERMGYESP